MKKVMKQKPWNTSSLVALAIVAVSSVFLESAAQASSMLDCSGRETNVVAVEEGDLSCENERYTASLQGLAVGLFTINGGGTLSCTSDYPEGLYFEALPKIGFGIGGGALFATYVGFNGVCFLSLSSNTNTGLFTVGVPVVSTLTIRDMTR